MRLSSRQTSYRCPYCFDSIQDDLEECEVCGTPHHSGCMDEHDGCTILGCDHQGGSCEIEDEDDYDEEELHQVLDRLEVKLHQTTFLVRILFGASVLLLLIALANVLVLKSI